MLKRIEKLEKLRELPTRRGVIDLFLRNLRKAYGSPDEIYPPAPTPEEFDRTIEQVLERAYGDEGAQ